MPRAFEVNHEMGIMTEKTVHANKVELCTEAFGDADDPAILLIMGDRSTLHLYQNKADR